MEVVDGGKKAKNKKLKSNLRNLPELKEINKELNKELTELTWNLLELTTGTYWNLRKCIWPSGTCGRAACR